MNKKAKCRGPPGPSAPIPQRRKDLERDKNKAGKRTAPYL